MLRKTLFTAGFLFCISGLFALPLRAEEAVKTSDESPAGGSAKEGKG